MAVLKTKVWRLFAALLLAFVLLSLAVLPAAAVGGTADTCVIDEDGLLAENEKADIAAALSSVDTDCQLVFYIYKYRGYYASEGDFYRYDVIDKPKNVLLLEVCKEPDEYTFVVHHFGETEKISSGEMEYLEDLIETDVKAGRFVLGATTFAEKGKKAFEGKLCPWGRMFAIGAVIALFAAGIPAVCVVVSYRRKKRGETYPLNRFANLDLTERDDVCLGTSVTRTLVESSSSRGGFSGGGFSGGGRSGGGGHSSGSRR